MGTLKSPIKVELYVTPNILNAQPSPQNILVKKIKLCSFFQPLKKLYTYQTSKNNNDPIKLDMVGTGPSIIPA
jgi:hypothetical protein